jgi:hypothetical protein
MAFTFFFIIIPLLVIGLPFIGALFAMFARGYERNQKITLNNAKLWESHLKQEAMQEARAARSMIAEAKAAEANNKTVIQDLNIELLKLKIAKAEADLGRNVPDFDPDDHGG